MARDETRKRKIKWIIIRYPGDSPQGEEWWATLGCHQQAEYIEMEHDQFGQVRFEIKPPGQLVRLVIPGPAAAIEIGYEGESPKHGPPAPAPADYTKPDEFKNLRGDETFVTEGVVWHRIEKVSASYYGPVREKDYIMANGAFCPERNHLIHFAQDCRVFRIPRKPEPPADSPYTEVCEFGDLAPGATFERRSRSDSDGSVVVSRWKRIRYALCLPDEHHNYLVEHAAFNLATGRIDYFNRHDRMLRIPVEVPNDKA